MTPQHFSKYDYDYHYMVIKFVSVERLHKISVFLIDIFKVLLELSITLWPCDNSQYCVSKFLEMSLMALIILKRERKNLLLLCDYTESVCIF